MIERRLEKEVLQTLQRTASAALLGPRQVGKTTLAFHISEQQPSIYLDLENPLDLKKVHDIIAFHEANREKLIILDEIQRLPEIFAPITGRIKSVSAEDNKRTTKGAILLTFDKISLQQQENTLLKRKKDLMLWLRDAQRASEIRALDLDGPTYPQLYISPIGDNLGKNEKAHYLNIFPKL